MLRSITHVKLYVLKPNQGTIVIVATDLSVF